MRILLFGGTTEGRILAHALKKLGDTVTVSVATPVGAEGLEDLDVQVGRLDTEAMMALFRDCDLCVDATHPYAREARETIRSACELAEVPLRRVSRPASDSGESIVVPSGQAAAAFLQKTEGPILLTAGAKELTDFRCLDPGRLYARVLPTHESIASCEAIGLPHRNILALWGPFSAELNAALIRQYGIRWLVTKDGGTTGGFDEKLQAAAETDARVLLIRRPEDSSMTVEEFLEEREKGGLP